VTAAALEKQEKGGEKEGEAVLVWLERLFDRVDPEGCTWTLEPDTGVVIVSMEKSDPRPWARLTLAS